MTNKVGIQTCRVKSYAARRFKKCIGRIVDGVKKFKRSVRVNTDNVVVSVAVDIARVNLHKVARTNFNPGAVGKVGFRSVCRGLYPTVWCKIKELVARRRTIESLRVWVSVAVNVPAHLTIVCVGVAAPLTCSVVATKRFLFVRTRVPLASSLCLPTGTSRREHNPCWICFAQRQT